MAETQERFGFGGLNNQIVGPVITAAATIAPTYGITHVTGGTAIVTITPPWTNFAGTICLIPDDAAGQSMTAAGNIALAVTLVQKKALYLTYDPATAKWYPSYVA